MIISNAVLAALRTGFRREFNEAYAGFQADSFYGDVAFRAPSSTGSNTYGWLGEFPGLREWIGDRVVKDIKEDSYVIQNKLWESTLGVARTDIEDDNLGMYTGLIQGMAQQAAIHPDQLVADLMDNGETRLCYDGQNFFDTDHPVFPNEDGSGVAVTASNFVAGAEPAWYLIDDRRTFKPFIFQERMAAELDSVTDPKSGGAVFMNDQYMHGVRARHAVGYGFWQLAYKSKAALTPENFRAARTAMRGLTADGGRKLGIRPTKIVISAALQSTAEKLFLNQLAAGGETNDLYKAVDILDVDWLA